MTLLDTRPWPCHPDLEKDILPRDRAQHLKEMLDAGPWGWPSSGPPLLRARRIAQARTPTHQARCGQMILVSCDAPRRVATAWLADMSPARLPTRRATFVGSATVAWSRACVALPHALPFLWSPLYQLSQQLPAAWPLGTLHQGGDLAHERLVLEGPSFGLGFALMLASRLLRQPLPADLSASVSLRRNGDLSPVEGLELKLLALTRLAPGVRRVFLHSNQAQQGQRLAEKIAAGHQRRPALEVLPVKDLAQALELAFPQMAQRLDQTLRNPHTLAEVTQSLFEMCLGSRHQTWRWEPVQRTAEHLLEHHGDALDEAQRQRLAYVRAVSSRHEGQAEPSPEPHESWLRDLAVPLRLRVLAHTLQQAISVRRQDPEALIQKALGQLPAVEQSFPDHLRARGALGRLYAVRGQLREAIELQREVARAWLSHLKPSEVSYSLCQWLLLSAALGDRASFQEAQDFNRTFQALNGLREYNHAYVDLNQARGLHLLGQDEQAIPLLQAWLSAENLPRPVRLAIWRHWAALHPPPTPQEQALRQDAAASPLARAFCLLLDLERHQDDPHRSQELIEQLSHSHPEPTGQLLDHFTQAQAQAPRLFPTQAAYLTRCFPY